MNNVAKNLLALLLGILCVVFLVMRGWISEKLVWVLLGGICILIFMLQKQFRRNLLIISILGFLTGWRGINISSSFIVYPTELFLWLGLLVFLIDQLSGRMDVHPPRPMLLEIILLVFAVLGGITALFFGRPLLDILATLKSFLVFIPMLVLFRSWIQDKHQVVFYARLLIVVGMIISMLGLLERYVPQIAAIFPNYMYAPTENRINFEFGTAIQLAGFSSWGTPVVSTLLVLLSGLAIFIPKPQKGWQKYGWFFVLPVLILGIISSGYRSAWLGLVPVIILGMVLNGVQVLPWIASATAGSLVLFSSTFIDRFRTVLFVKNSRDPSVLTRSLALQNGLLTIKSNFFFGTGWNSPTAFNDWINVGVYMGGLGLLVFVTWYGWLLIKLFGFARKAKSTDAFLLHMSFITALVGYSIAMFSGAMSQIFPIMTGFWFVFCLGWRLVEISHEEELINGEAVSLATNL